MAKSKTVATNLDVRDFLEKVADVRSISGAYEK